MRPADRIVERAIARMVDGETLSEEDREQVREACRLLRIGDTERED